MIFVRHGLAVATPDTPTHEWPLDPAHVDDIVKLRPALPALRVVSSDMRRAEQTAAYFGEPATDPRLAEVSRPWTADLEASVARYLFGERLESWEPQADVRARMQAAVDEHGEAIYVTHGTALTLYLASVVPTLDAMRFWTELTNPDAWHLDGARLVRLHATTD